MASTLRERVAWTGGLVALYAVLLGSRTLDAVDSEFPRRVEVAALADPAERLAVELGPGGEDVPAVGEALASLPGPLVARAKREGLRVRITDLATLKQSGAEAAPMSVVAGLFVPRSLEILIAHDTEHPGLTALHEFGHYLDHTLGNCSASPRFQALWDRADDGTTRRYYLAAAPELFAHYVTEYYFSDRRRDRLVEEQPEAAALLRAIEASARAGEARCPRES
ncbi:MAG: hypothetical protein R3B72_16865 [Polyangiaceae bacterium]